MRPRSRWATHKPNNAAAVARAREYASRAYREAHERDRRLVASGHAVCWRCRRPIPATARCGPDWHSGHDDNDRSILRGPEHRQCNLSAAGRKGARVANAQRRTPPVRRGQSRNWFGSPAGGAS